MSWLITPINTLPLATGGDIVSDVFINGRMYRIHQFTTVGTSTLTVLRGGQFEYLIIGGGGGGGSRTFGTNVGAGGGGAGGYRCSVPGEQSGGLTSAENPAVVTPGTYTVIVGAGGLGATAAANDNYNLEIGTTGSVSSIFNITALGGGGAEQISGSFGSAGGRNASGNNSAVLGTSGQGSSGGSTSGVGEIGAGGGGAASAGSSGSLTGNGNGGNGITSAITGTPVIRAGGGGGGRSGIGGNGGGGNGGSAYYSVGANGLANTGGGGGGAASTKTILRAGGNGGSGIVIVRYAIA